MNYTFWCNTLFTCLCIGSLRLLWSISRQNNNQYLVASTNVNVRTLFNQYCFELTTLQSPLYENIHYYDIEKQNMTTTITTTKQ